MAVTHPTLAAIDIGTHTVNVVIAHYFPEQQKFEVIGLASRDNLGMQQGYIVDLEKLSLSIQDAVQDAEDMANCDIHSAYVAIPSNGLQSDNVSGSCTVDGDYVSALDLAKAFEIAKTKCVQPNLYLVHALKLGVEIDSSEQWSEDPTGLSAKKITSHYHVMQMPISTMQNVEKVLKISNKEVEQTILSMVATSEAALRDSEKEHGVCLLDIGGSSIDVAIYIQGKLVHSQTIAMGGETVSKDIALKFNTSAGEAEKLKCKHGCLDMGRIKPDQTVLFYELSASQATTRTRLELSEVMVARYNEMLEPVYQAIADILGELNCGIVYTGGASQVEGIEVFLKQFFGIKRVHKYAHPVNVTAQPNILLDLQRMSYSTVCGLLMYSQKHYGVSSLKDSILPKSTNSFIHRYIINPWGLFKQRFLNTF